MNTPAALDAKAKHITMDKYLRKRLQPHVRDTLYLHLQDLRLLLETIRTGDRLKILDYSCGSSPYRSLFPNAEYKRADFLDVGDLDYRLGADSRVPEADQQFDLIISTQAMEHVPEPQVYLAECFRLLKPGGRLFLTTHGVYEDHGCPYDFYRWTADGLHLAVSHAGFQNLRLHKLTSGPRAILFMLGTNLDAFSSEQNALAGFLFRCYRRLFRFLRPRIHAMADTHFSRFSVVPATEPGHSLYACVAVQAERPR